MVYFSLILFKIIPLYANIMIGYLSGKFLNACRDTIAKLLFYMISPIVIFNGVMHTPLLTNILVLPLVTFGIGSILAALFYRMSRTIWNDASEKLAAFSAGTGNTGYFGLPIALLLFDNLGESIYIMSFLGITLYESTVGYYFLSKGTHTPKKYFAKLLTIPSMHALVLGLLFNVMHVPDSALFNEFVEYMKGTYIVLGMMIIGLRLGGLGKLKIDFKFIGVTFLAKFVAWPLFVLLLIMLDTYVFHFFNSHIYNALLLLSIVPIGVNTVVMGSIFNCQPDKAATAVISSFILAMVYVPFMVMCFIQEQPEIKIEQISEDQLNPYRGPKEQYTYRIEKEIVV